MLCQLVMINFAAISNLFLIRHESVELSHFKTKLHEEITLSSAAICQIVVALFQGVLF